MPLSLTNLFAEYRRPAALNRTVYGVALAGNAMTVVRSQRGHGHAVRHTVLSPAEQAAWLAHPGLGKDIVAGSLSAQHSLTLWLSAPFASRRKAAKVLPSLLDIQLPFPLEDCLYDFLGLECLPDRTCRALAVAVRRETLQARLEQYRRHGLDPVWLEPEGLALWTQSLLEIPPASDAGRIILYRDREDLTVVIGRGSQYQNAHGLQVPAGSATPTAEHDLLSRLNRILLAELPPGTPVQWIAAGPGCQPPTQLPALHATLAKTWPGPLTLPADPAAFLARALATRALTAGPLRCNLRKDDLTHPAIRRKVERQSRRATILLLTAGLLWCGFNLAWLGVAGHRVSRVQAAVQSLAADLAPGRRIPYGQEVAEVTKALSRQNERLDPFARAFTPLLSDRLREILQTGQACDASFSALVLQSNSVAIAGAAETWDAALELQRRLTALGYTVKLDRREGVPDNQVYFSINGTRK